MTRISEIVLGALCNNTLCSFQVNSFAYLENAEWQYNKGYVTTEIFPMCCPESIAITININLSFTRLRPFYVINLIVPAMLFSACMVLTFLLPTECGERLGYSLTILLSYTVLMTITSSMMPTTSKQTPHISMSFTVLSSHLLLITVDPRYLDFGYLE